jgi:hypothetical protein
MFLSKIRWLGVNKQQAVGLKVLFLTKKADVVLKVAGLTESS